MPSSPSFGTMTVSVIVSVGPLNSTMMLTSAFLDQGSNRGRCEEVFRGNSCGERAGGRGMLIPEMPVGAGDVAFSWRL
jgi:hypothetical protein